MRVRITGHPAQHPELADLVGTGGEAKRTSPARRTVEAAISTGGMSRAARRAAKKRLKGIGKGKAK